MFIQIQVVKSVAIGTALKFYLKYGICIKNKSYCTHITHSDKCTIAFDCFNYCIVLAFKIARLL